MTPAGRGAGLAAVIFDLDGTLVETERDGHRPAFNQAFAAHGLPYEWSVEEYGELLALTGGRRRVQAYLDRRDHPGDRAALAAAVHRTKTERFARWVRTDEAVAARPGARRLIRDLTADGVAVAVATTGRGAWARPLLDRLFGAGSFATVVTGDDVEHLKPHPEAYALALARLGLPAVAALAVEDSPPGLASALAAGLGCAVVRSAYNRAAPFPGALAVTDGFDEPPEPGSPGHRCLAAGVTLDALRCLHAAGPPPGR